MSTVLEEDVGILNADDIRDLKLSASSLYGGGADTTVSAEYAFYLAMVLFPGRRVYLSICYHMISIINHIFHPSPFCFFFFVSFKRGTDKSSSRDRRCHWHGSFTLVMRFTSPSLCKGSRDRSITMEQCRSDRCAPPCDPRRSHRGLLYSQGRHHLV